MTSGHEDRDTLAAVLVDVGHHLVLLLVGEVVHVQVVQQELELLAVDVPVPVPVVLPEELPHERPMFSSVFVQMSSHD